MARQARTEPSLTEWAVLGLLREGSAHGWDVARAFAPDGPLGNVWTVSRPLVYRAITVLRDLGYVEDRGSTPSSSGPERVLLAPTPRGRAAFRRWLGRPVVACARSPLRAPAQAPPPRARGPRPGAAPPGPARRARARRARAPPAGRRERGLRPHRGDVAADERPRGPRLRRGAPRRARPRSRCSTTRSASCALRTRSSTGCRCSRPPTARARRGSTSPSRTAAASSTSTGSRMSG